MDKTITICNNQDDTTIIISSRDNETTQKIDKLDEKALKRFALILPEPEPLPQTLEELEDLLEEKRQERGVLKERMDLVKEKLEMQNERMDIINAFLEDTLRLAEEIPEDGKLLLEQEFGEYLNYNNDNEDEEVIVDENHNLIPMNNNTLDLTFEVGNK